MSRRIQIYDTTLRDGTQGEGVNFSLEDKLAIAQKLDSLGFDYIEGGYPLSNKKDAEFFKRAQELNLKNAKICAFGMTRRRGIKAEDDPGMQALINSGAPVVTLVGKTSDFHVKEVLRVSEDENLEMISDSVACLIAAGREVIYDAEHFFDGWKSNAEYAKKTIQSAANAGATMIVLCDTNGGSLPEEIAEITKHAMEVTGVPVGIHCHNDGDLATANSLASVDAGALQVQGTINGFGERCGNADLTTVVANLLIKKEGYEALNSDGVAHLTELSRYMYETANMHYRGSQPFVGESAFAHKGGMHVHAVNRVASSYEHIDPELVGNERRFLVSELSGRSNIAVLANKHKFEPEPELMKNILAEVVARENEGYQFELAEASFALLVRRITKSYTPCFDLKHYRVNVEAEPGHAIEMNTEATVKLQVGNQTRHEVGEGDGPVNAIDAALRKALTGVYPGIKEMRLVDYKVRVINSGAGTAAKVRVIIESKDDNETWGTVGVHENIIEASWMALVDSFEYKIFKDRGIGMMDSPEPMVSAAD